MTDRVRAPRPTVRADRGRFQRDFEALAAFGRQASGGLMREAYTPAFIQARDFVRECLSQMGLSTRVDAVGNVFGRTPELGAVVLTGSHLDAVRNGGIFDGPAGVIAAIEAVRAIRQANIRLRRPIEVVGFVEEEGRFTGLLGSAVMVGLANLERLPTLRDEDGVLLPRALSEAGLDVRGVRVAVRGADEIAAFVELHVEQGAVLETEGFPIGLVTAIAGTHRLAVELSGRADHAGATPMDARQDALLAAAEIVLAARRLVLESDRPTARATVGQLHVEPNVTSAVPERVRLVVDVRDVDAEARAGLAARIEAAIATACGREGVRHRVTNPMSAMPMPTHPGVRDAIAAACAELELPYLPLMSGASHDALNLAQRVPTGMIFVPSRGGRSHSPAEFTAMDDLLRGTDVLIGTLLELAC